VQASFVNVEGKADTLAQVSAALDIYDKTQDALKEQYNYLHNYLSRMKLLKKGGERLERGDAISKHIAEKNKEFAAALQVDLGAINSLTGNNVLSAAKILLSHHRRLERYHLFFVEGRVKVSGGAPRIVASSPSIDGSRDA
jgi:hypothetical protein